MLGIFSNRKLAVAHSLILGAFLTFWLVTGSQTHTGFNISRAQYEAALAKWNGLNVTDYEAIVQRSDEDGWRIVVHVDRFDSSVSHRITHFERLDGLQVEPGVSAYDFFTVGDLFNWIDDEFYAYDQPPRHWGTPGYYDVKFDDNLGYPRSFTSINKYATFETRIESVHILK